MRTVLCWMAAVLAIAAAEAGLTAEAGRGDPSRMGCLHCNLSEIAEIIKSADRLYAQFRPKEAARELARVLQLDRQNFEALAKLARAYIDIGDMIPESSPDWQSKRLSEYKTAEEYARHAVAVDPASTWGHFYVAWSLGSIAMVSPVSRQVELAGEIRTAIEKAIALDPNNGFAYHAYGVWHRKMAEIGKMTRMFANVLYGRSLPGGSLEKSVELLKRAIALNPNVIVSRLELARTYIATETWSQARSYLNSIDNLPIQFSDDSKHKRSAKQLLEEIKDR